MNANINKLFLDYNLSLEMKEIEFDEPCFKYGDINSSYIDIPSSIEERMVNPFNKSIKMPTFSQAFRWFRENYGLDGEVNKNDKVMIDYVASKGETYLPLYCWSYCQYNSVRGGTAKTYEEAELACLEKLIEIVKKSKS